ncbi:PREDICTED: microtubule-associated protein futsch-like isoform X2 [Vollenhovia emeryi]|uniref:microtubule-associated protein futsch-like isoform X2 n=1 Tax=Vollenhovia emeryi TaxID=411798 RepID=UPI0005F3AE1E|nr:PREDICTED: microtubule-associated protein futsch-like isoform X2 [Vollenhovia emeryi]
MLSSKANAALARLKEIEEKYKIKRKEQKWKEDADSSISSVSLVSSENPSAKSGESPRGAARPKLDIKMPDARYEGHAGDAEETKLSSKSDRSTPDEASAFRPAEDAAAVQLDDKSPRSAGKQESLISDNSMTIRESSLIESVPDDTVTPSKSHSRSKTSRRNSSTAGDRSSGREERTRMSARSEGGRESVKSSEISRGKAPSDNSSIKRLRMSGGSSERVFRARHDPKKRSMDKVVAKTPRAVGPKVRDDTIESESLRDDSVVEESIGTLENGSEIISELSRAEESSVAKIEDAVNGGSKHPTDVDASVVTLDSWKGLAPGNGYANDTFEDISSSTVRSRRGGMINGRREAADKARFSAKKIDTAEYRSSRDSSEKHRDELIIAPKPSATEVEPGSSDYVSDLESVVASPDSVAVRSVKLPRSSGARSENRGERYQRRKASRSDENVSSVASSNKNTSDSSDSSTGDVMKTDERKNSPGMTTVRQVSGRKERGESSNRAKERAVVIDVTGLPVASDEDGIKETRSNSSLEETEKRTERVSEESLNQGISQDAERVVRKSHKDALAKSSTVATKASESSSGGKTVSASQNAPKTRRVKSDHNCRGQRNTKRKKKSARTTNSRTAGARDSTRSRKEDKALSLDGKQTRGLRKHIIELRLRQEREDLQKYLHELKDLRLESVSARSYFKPLEFPRIAEFTQPDINDVESKPDDRFRERVSAIRRWLKDQYILYRDYCTMAQAINAHYVPTTLDDAKKTIRELRNR